MKTFLKINKWMAGGRAGFSLLEILIAISILATSFVALLSLQASSFLAGSRAREISAASFLAAQKMVEIEIEVEKDLRKNKFPSLEVVERGEFEEPFEDYRWKYTIKKVEIPVVNPGGEEGQNAMVGNYIKNVMDQISKSVRELQLTVFWGDKDKPEEDQSQFVLTTHIVKLN